MSEQGRSRSPRRRQSQSRSRSRSHSASSMHRHHRHDEHKNARYKGADKLERKSREEVAMERVVNSDEDEMNSSKSEDKKHGDEVTHRKHRHHSRLHSRRHSSESKSLDKTESEQYRHKRKHKHRTLDKDKKRPKKKKKDSKSTKRAVNQDEYGKYGILRESDFHNKSISFQAWLREVKRMAEFNGPKWETMELFKEYMEDYNTCTMPHKKYYDVEKYEMQRYQKEQRKALEKQKGTSDRALDTLADEEQVRRERLDAREKKEQEEFRLVLRLMDKDKIDAMREQERLRAQMQLFYKSGNVEEARRLEHLLNKVEEDPRFKR